MAYTFSINPALNNLYSLQISAGVTLHTRIFRRTNKYFEGRCFCNHIQTASHGYACAIGGGDGIVVVAEIIRQLRAGKESHRRARATGGIGFFASHGRKYRIAGVLLRPDNGMPARAGIEMILHIAEFAVASPQVPSKAVFLCCTRSRAVCISAAYDTHDERVDTIFLPVRQTILIDIAHHIATGKVLNHGLFSAVGSNDAINRPQHAEVIAGYLLEITQLIFCIETNAPESIKATFGCALMLYQFHQGLEEQPVVKLLLCFGISEHQPA